MASSAFAGLWAARASSALAVLLGSLSVALPAGAHAAPAEAPEQVELDYVSSAECPSKASFVGEVTARIRRPVTWVVLGARVRIALSLSTTEGVATGRLEVARPGAPPTRREFTAASCTEVGSALALVVALTLDPDARTDALPEPAPQVAEAPPAAPDAPLPPSPAPPRPVSSSSSSPPPVPPPPSPPALRYVAWLGPVAGVSVGYSPEALVTLGVSLGARLSRGSAFSPTLQLTPLWGKTGSTGPRAALGSFAWAMARLEACPVHLELSSVVGFSPCVLGEVGRLAASGTADGVAPTAAERWWAAPGVTAALHLDRPRWFVRLSGEALFPATRDEFVFREPERSVHRASAFAYGLRLGLGFQLGP